jgi:hypothetical protein
LFNNASLRVGHNNNINFYFSDYDFLLDKYFSEIITKSSNVNKFSSQSNKISIDDFRYLFLFPFESKFDYRLQIKQHLVSHLTFKKYLNNIFATATYAGDFLMDTTYSLHNKLLFNNFSLLQSIFFFNLFQPQKYNFFLYDSCVNKNTLFQAQNIFFNHAPLLFSIFSFNSNRFDFYTLLPFNFFFSNLVTVFPSPSNFLLKDLSSNNVYINF